MKRFNLISILILFISFIGVQSVVGQYYSYEYPNEHELMNGWGTKNDFNTGTLPYPSNQIYFEAYLEDNVTSSHKVKVLGNEYELNTNPKTTGVIIKQHDSKYGDDALSGSPLKETINFSTSTNAITFTSSRDGAKKIYIKNIKVCMAPHILLSDITLPGKADDESKKIGVNETSTPTSTATSTKTATINFGSMRYDAEERTATIKIKSGLSSGSWSTTLSNPSEGFSFTGGLSSSDDKFIAIGNQKDIVVTFTPQNAGVTTTTKTITKTIKISGAGTDNDVIITLTATVNPPKTQTISWNQTFNDPLRIGDVITLNATTNSGLPIAYTSNNTNA